MSDLVVRMLDRTGAVGEENRPGQSGISYRVRSYAGFLQAMRSSLATTWIEGKQATDLQDNRPLQKLTTPDSGDPTLALLDAWACVADVLTFYQERIANEGYLRTALDRRSLVELSRLVKYAPRPGVASSVYLSFTVENNASLKIPAGTPVQSVPASDDQPQISQTFETSADLWATSELNLIQPQLVAPLVISNQGSDPNSLNWPSSLTVAGLNNNLHVGDAILINVIDSPAKEQKTGDPKTVVPKSSDVDSSIQAAFQITTVSLLKRDDAFGDRTVITIEKMEFQAAPPPAPEASDEKVSKNWAVSILRGVQRLFTSVTGKRLQPTSSGIVPVALRSVDSPQPPPVERKVSLGENLQAIEGAATNSNVSTASIADGFTVTPSPADVPQTRSITEGGMQLLEEMSGADAAEAVESYAAAVASPMGGGSTKRMVEVFVFRTQAAPFGRDAPLQPTASAGNPVTYSEWPPGAFADALGSSETQLILNKSYPNVRPGQWVMVVTPLPPAGNDNPVPIFARICGVADRTATGLGMAVNTTQLSLNKAWRDSTFPGSDVRQTTVWAGSEKLDVSMTPIDDTVPSKKEGAGATSFQVALNKVYRGLEMGRTLILSGQLTSPPVTANDMVSVAAVEHVLGGETKFTRVTLNRNLPQAVSQPANQGSIKGASPAATNESPLPQRAYDLATVKLLGNVVNATHGETRREVLGSGDASVPLQTFSLKASPLTYLSAPSQSGSQTTLAVYVNDIRWHEAIDGMADAGPNDHLYVVRNDQSSDGTAKSSIIFGNGAQGAVVPTGRENVRAVYRTGIGTPGNVAAGRISQLKSRPHGLKGVINPLAASGGADAETADAIRANAPVGVRTLGRLVSFDDYRNFALSFAGVTKANAVLALQYGQRVIRIIVAGDDPDPLDPNSDLMKNLNLALAKYGTQSLAARAEPHQRQIVLLGLNVTIYPDFVWTNVQQSIRDALLFNFGFAGQQIGENIYQSDVARIVQNIPGVQYVKLTNFASVQGNPLDSPDELARRITSALSSDSDPAMYSKIKVECNQIAYLSPDIDHTLVINQENADPTKSIGGGA